MIAGAIVLLILGLLAIVAGYYLGNPFELFSAGPRPAIKPLPARPMPVPAAALPVPLDLPAPPVIPPPIPGSFSIVVGTYDNARQSQIVEAQLRAQKIEPYQIDIVMAPDDVQRRILIGRFATREEAEAAREKLGPLFTTARVIPGSMERARVLIP